MKMPPFKLYTPSSVEEAIQIAKKLQSKKKISIGFPVVQT